MDGARIATAGSCFAQHIGRNLREKGFAYLDAEPAPAQVSPALASEYGYGMYSARYGNIYTARQLLQLLQRANGSFRPTEDYWIKGDGVVDPFRPTIEPEPFGSVEELRAVRAGHLDCVAGLLRDADVFVFTLGLTEAWLSKTDGACYPLCPGTVAGVFDETVHAFRNLDYTEVRADMEAFIAGVRDINPKMRFLLTVSPVPLAATATDTQVAVATAYSKSVLRAVAGDLVVAHEFIDYFPSFEIITSPFMRGYFFQPDGREILPRGVEHVMSVFFEQHPVPGGKASVATGSAASDTDQASFERDMTADEVREKIKCDEELLSAFAPERNA
ncbi:GSCFA domain-containing protein [Pararhodobacter marinus]|uniref:GSCFA domain-containing protein n=1 Tax=Pararhodobacter marinus TaxID=2184063 RepID=UPI003516623B